MSCFLCYFNPTAWDPGVPGLLLRLTSLKMHKSTCQRSENLLYTVKNTKIKLENIDICIIVIFLHSFVLVWRLPNFLNSYPIQDFIEPKKNIFRYDRPAGSPQFRSLQTKLTFVKIRALNILMFTVRISNT
jgi:hypothetical protein